MSGIDKDLLTEYYRRYHKSLLMIALSYAKREADAEDLVQSAFTKAILSYEGTGSFLYWVNKVMRNEWHNLSRKRKRETSLGLDEENIAGENSPLEQLVEDENKRQLIKMIAALPDKYRDVMVESVYIGRSDEEIGQEYGLTAVNVRQIKSRAKKMLMAGKGEKDGFR